MVSNRIGDKKGTNLSNVIRFNEAIKTDYFQHLSHKQNYDIISDHFKQFLVD